MEYAEKVERITAHIMTTGEAPLVHGVAWRASSWTLMPCWCGACCLWSTCWRFMACPFMCACKGASYMCSNNGCTDMTDSLIFNYVRAVGEKETLSKPPPVDDPATLARILEAIAVVKGHFPRGVASFTANTRLLTSVVVVPLCSATMEFFPVGTLVL
jgi:hypothetical protein